MNKKLVVLAGALFSFNVSADICPEEGEQVVTTPYQLSMICPASTIVVKGERNPDKYESCFGDVPYASEQVYYVAHDKKLVALPTVNSLLRKGDFFALRLWVVGDLEPPTNFSAMARMSSLSIIGVAEIAPVVNGR